MEYIDEPPDKIPWPGNEIFREKYILQKQKKLHVKYATSTTTINTSMKYIKVREI